MKATLFRLSAGLLFMVGFLSCNSQNKKKEITQKDSVEYVQLATGQITLYDVNGEVLDKLLPGDTLFGQDANYTSGVKMSYQDNGNGTITDLNTGLMWQEIPVSDGFTWQDAVDYCEELELAGYDDWRIPSLKELFSISDFSSGWPYLDTAYFSMSHSGQVDKSEQYWSSNAYVGFTEEGRDNAAFGVNHATGHIKAYPAAMPNPGDNARPPKGHRPPPGQGPPPSERRKPRGNPFEKHVRAVRGNSYGINDFKDNGDGTITDKATGLMWSTHDSGKGLDWEDALRYAESAQIAGYSDWRLPNVKELQGIVDYSYAPNAKEPSKIGPAIDPLFSCTPITNEAGKSDYGYYWTSTSARFTKGKPCYYAWYVAFGRAISATGEDSHGAGAVRFDTKYEGGPAGEGGERYYNYVRLVRNISK